jgi:protein-tyrosine phosphatase
VTDENTRRVVFTGALNFRDIGGYPVPGGGKTRWRAVYRSDSLHFLTEADLAAFDALAVKVIYDLRADREVEVSPGPREYVRLAIPSGDLVSWPKDELQTREDGEKWLAADYLNMVTTAGPVFGELLTRLAADASYPCVVHCLAGKDRTGMSIALLLTALGVDRHTVLDDYELTSGYQAPRVAGVVDALAELGLGRPAVEALMSTPRWAMDRALQEVDKAQGGIDGYLLGPGGMSPQSLAALRANLVD